MKELDGLIDERNKSLYEKLLANHVIKIKVENRQDYSAYSINDTTVISIPSNDHNPASFTHELLHIYLRTKKIFIGAGLKLQIKNSRLLKNLFNDDLLEHIGNSLDHVKMLPIYTALGFNKTDFILDYHQDKLTDQELKDIQSHFISNSFFSTSYNSTAFRLLIGKFFAIKACPNTDFNYSAKLLRLKSINQELYDINERFFNAWLRFDIDDTDIITGSYQQFLYDYVVGLENWTKDKTIK